MSEARTTTMQERLYGLLPSVYRQSPDQASDILRAFMSVLEGEFQTLELDIEHLYDNWFIETCAEWAIPYIADLLGMTALHQGQRLISSQRRLVANTIGYRRRKGTLATLEQVAQDATGWHVHMVEYARHLAGTQHLAHIQPGRGRLVDLREPAALAQLDQPFDRLAHTISARQPAPVPGGHEMTLNSSSSRRHLPNSLGLFLWRLQSYQVLDVPATPVNRDVTTGRFLSHGRFLFDPLGRDTQLFSRPRAPEEITSRTTEETVPAPLSRTAFASDLLEHASRSPDARPSSSRYYGPDRSLYILVNGVPLAPQALVSADLSHWQAPRAIADPQSRQVAVDVVLGRMLFLPGRALTSNDVVEVSYNYGFSADLGAGPYRRPLAAAEAWTLDVRARSPIDTMTRALAAWEEHCQTSSRPRGTIRILDNGIYTEQDLTVSLPEDGRLTIQAAQGVRPVLKIAGSLRCLGSEKQAHLTLNGLLIDGPLEIAGNLKLEITHCTLMPGGLRTAHDLPPATPIQVSIAQSMVGPVHLLRGTGTLHIQDSILDHKLVRALPHHLAEHAHAHHAPEDETVYALSTYAPEHETGIVTTLARATIFGQVRLQELARASDVIFTEPVFVHRREQGAVSFSYVPARSQTPVRQHCQPDQATLTASTQSTHGQEQSLAPIFSSVSCGDPGYAQLDNACADQIRRGASDGMEMGAFHDLLQAQRLDNLSACVDEFFPFGADLTLHYLT